MIFLSKGYLSIIFTVFFRLGTGASKALREDMIPGTIHKDLIRKCI